MKYYYTFFVLAFSLYSCYYEEKIDLELEKPPVELWGLLKEDLYEIEVIVQKDACKSCFVQNAFLVFEPNLDTVFLTAKDSSLETTPFHTFRLNPTKYGEEYANNDFASINVDINNYGVLTAFTTIEKFNSLPVYSERYLDLNRISRIEREGQAPFWTLEFIYSLKLHFEDMSRPYFSLRRRPGLAKEQGAINIHGLSQFISNALEYATTDEDTTEIQVFPFLNSESSQVFSIIQPNSDLETYFQTAVQNLVAKGASESSDPSLTFKGRFPDHNNIQNAVGVFGTYHEQTFLISGAEACGDLCR
jgi:hypothetical protein